MACKTWVKTMKNLKTTISECVDGIDFWWQWLLLPVAVALIVWADVWESAWFPYPLERP